MIQGPFVLCCTKVIIPRRVHVRKSGQDADLWCGQNV